MDILSVLKEKNIDYKSTNDPNSIMIRCISGTHVDNNPSLSYHLGKNLFQCWSCGFKGNAKKFLETLGYNTRIPIETKHSFRVEVLKSKIRQLINKEEVILPSVMDVVDFPFKGISKNTLESFNAFTTNELGLEDYICIPIYQYGRLKFIEGRLSLTDSSRSKYYRRPQGVSASKVLFPIDKLTKTSHVILVEGLFDMLNLWQHGYDNTLCIFGTQNFGPAKVSLLDQIGVTKVTILMDGDASGAKATASIQKLLKQNNIQTYVVTLPSGKDPGDLTKTEMEYFLK